MLRFQLFFWLGFLVVFQLPAQNIQFSEDPQVGAMMNRFTEINKSREFIPGWRIQILATTDRQRMESVKQAFQYRYPNITVDYVHSKPYYKLQAGAFSTKLEATRLLYILKRDYPSAYLAKDKAIPTAELVGNY